MNTTVIKASIDAGKSLAEIATILGDGTIVDLAKLIKYDEARIKEFLSTFLHRKKISVKLRWDSLVILNRKMDVFKLINIDSDGNFDYIDGPFLQYAIDRYVALVGVPVTHANISNGIAHQISNQYNSYVKAMYVMTHFVKQYEAFLYSEFATDFYSPEQLLTAVSIVNEINES
jgi:hypothetical protein